MAAHDRETRRQAAVAAARARLARMSDDETPDMTDAARRALHRHDLATIDSEAVKLGQYPLDDKLREFRAGVRRAIRIRRADDEAKRLHKRQSETQQQSFESGEQLPGLTDTDQGGAA